MIECLVCAERYSAEDVESGLYQISTFVCSRCYAKMQALPHARSCFGKPTFVLSGRRLLGHDPEAAECSEVCPDRIPCSKVAGV